MELPVEKFDIDLMYSHKSYIAPKGRSTGFLGLKKF